MRNSARQILAIMLATSTSYFASPAALAQQNYPQSVPAAQQILTGVDLPSLDSEAILWLQGLIRINTSNPPGNELAAAKYVAGILQKEGITPEIYETAPGRGFLVARLSANPVPDPSRALLLMAHLDVVGVDASKWTADPFGAAIRGGYIYGRGAIDDKGMLAANLAVFIALKRSQARLHRDVIFLAEDDEEAGGDQGMRMAVGQHWDKIACGFALNEGGRVAPENGKVQSVGVQASEKVYDDVDVIATGTSGHASMPRKDNPVVHLAAAMAKIGAYQAPVQFNAVTRAYFEGMAATEDAETARWMRALDDPVRAEHAEQWLSDANPAWNSMLRDTVVPTMLRAGIRQNVIPSEARGVMNIRLMPGNMLDPLLAKLQQIVNDPQIRFKTEPDAGVATPSSSLDSDLFHSIQQVSQQEFPGAAVVPFMSTGATDSMYLRVRGVQAYGLLPFPLTREDEERMHADDERIPLDSFRQGVEFLLRVVTNFAVTQ